ncbi:MAG: hypothetical protein ACK5JU_05810 [Bacteroidales bacterium]
MKEGTYLGMLCMLLLTSCVLCNDKYDNIAKENKRLIHENDSLNELLRKSETRITNLSDSLQVYSYPANQRFNAIMMYIKTEDFDRAQKEIVSLQSVFPNSKEAIDCEKQKSIIEKNIAIKKAEEERIKALGFKAIKQKTAFEIDYNKISISSISIGSQFTFDSYGDRYFYQEADRDNKYVTARMSVTSNNKYPMLPQFAIYAIKGNEMIYESSFSIRYARWDDYGSYLGNEADFNNVFSKTSTVVFKIGAEIETSITKSAFAIVSKNENVLTEKYSRFDNPPKSWIGYADFAMRLKVDDFKKDYTLIKIYNLN